MPLRTVTLNYDPNNAAAPFGPDPHQVPVLPGDSIHFVIGGSTRATQPNCRLEITLHRGEHFSKAHVRHEQNQDNAQPLVIDVHPELAAALPALRTQAVPVITAYSCQLLRHNGDPIPGLSADGTDGSGGEIVPDSSGS
jgi:hypothetical protein